MNGIEIKKTYLADFEKIYPLLIDFNAPYAKEDWQKIFSYRWEGVEDYVGFHLEKQGEIVGFMGLIFSIRSIANHSYKFCNITSLIVKQEHRAATLLLVRKLKSIENTIFTGLRPINESYQILTLMGFQAFEQTYTIVPMLLRHFLKKQPIAAYQYPDLLTQSNTENKRVVQDHAKLNCHMVLFSKEDRQCLLVYRMSQNNKKFSIKKIQLLHISDVNFFNQQLVAIAQFFKKNYGYLAFLYLDKRYLNKKIFALDRPIHPPRICYNPYKNQINIDELYSEAVLL